MKNYRNNITEIKTYKIKMVQTKNIKLLLPQTYYNIWK